MAALERMLASDGGHMHLCRHDHQNLGPEWVSESPYGHIKGEHGTTDTVAAGEGLSPAAQPSVIAHTTTNDNVD